MLEQRIVKVVQQYAFFILKGEGFVIKKNIFFNILKKYFINKDAYINNNNDISILLSDLSYYCNIYNKYDYIPYIKPNDEKQLINTQLFNNDINFNKLISFICNYLNHEKKINDFSSELVKYYLMKRPLKNFNIFSITRYINSLYYIIIFNSYNAKNIINKNREYKTYNNIPQNDVLKSENIQFSNETRRRCLSLDDNKSSNLKKINTIYAMKKKIGLNKDYYKYLGDSTYNINDNLVNKEIVNQIYEDYNNNKKYMKRRSVNFENNDKFKIKRHVARLSSCNVNNTSFGNINQPKNTLGKKKFMYINKKNK